MRPRNLTRQFSLLSLILVILAAWLLGTLLRQHEVTQLERLASGRNVALAQLLRNLLVADIHALVAPAAPGIDGPAGSASAVGATAARIAPLIHDTDIVKVKIFDLQGLTVFSTDPGAFGESRGDNPAFQAARAGEVRSELVHRNHFSAFDGDRHDVDLLSSYVPVRENGQVIAVFELYQDVTQLLGEIDRALWSVWGIVASILAALYVLQLLVVRRAQRAVVEQQLLLEANNRDLDQRVSERSRQIEDLLRQQQIIFDNAHVGILLLQQRRILQANQRAAELFGYASAEALTGQSTRIFYHSDEDFAAIGRQGYRQLAEQGYANFESPMLRQDGESIWVMQSGRPLDPDAVLDGPSIWTYTDISELRRAEDQIRQLAFFDQLTGLPNRTLLLDRLKQAMAASERSQRLGAVLFLDLDHFKALNDTAGHDQGDRLLCLVAQQLSDCVRHCDTVARLGGDEFVIILADLESTAMEAAAVVEVVCRKLLAALRQTHMFNGSEFHCTASIGVTLFSGMSASTDDLLRQADLAMYKSKDAGRNGFTFFDQAMGSAVLARLRMQSDLRRGIQEAQFELFYQAQIDSKSGRIAGAEALLRWHHPERGLVMPGEFIASAEESGLILPLGQWVLATACRQLAAWASQPGLDSLCIAVNVSVQQFLQADFVNQVRLALEQSGADPTRLKIELTESVLVANIDAAIEKMGVLKRLGVGFSLDDFGTGYSSMAYLSRLPLDQLKIDRSFVAELENRDTDAAICAATISLAHSLRLKVVAEGVETDAQRYFLANVHHCDLLQGYLISRPIALAQFESLCREQKVR